MKKSFRKVLDLLPQRIRLTLLRKKIKVETEWPSPSLVIKIADTEEELASAYSLLHDSYVGANFMDPDPTGMRILAQHLLPQTTTIVAKWNDDVIGTVSLIRDNPLGLPLEKIFDVSDRRMNGRRLAEVSSLAISPKFRGQANRSLFPIFRYVIQYAHHYFGVHELIIAVNPSMSDLYMGVLCFEKLQTKARAYDFVKGAPAVGLYLNFETASERWESTFNKKSSNENFFRYWSDIPTNPNYQLPERRYQMASDPVLTPELLKNFFLKRARLADKLNLNEIKALMDAYPFPNFQNELVHLRELHIRKTLRLETHMKASWGDKKTLVEILNVSRDGLLLRSTIEILSLGQLGQLIVWLNKDFSTTLIVEVSRSPSNYLYGLKIKTSSREWLMMIEELEKKHKKSDELSLARGITKDAA